MTLHQQYVDSWYIYSEKLNGFRPLKFSGVDARKISDIRKTILKAESGNEESALIIWQKILNHLYLHREGKQRWLSRQPLQVVESRIGQLIAEILSDNQKRIEPIKKVDEYLKNKYA